MMHQSSRAVFGSILKHWRGLRGFSQLALSIRVETTTRHLSYLENGKSRPGRELVLRIGEALELPLRVRNELLASVGLAPEFPARELGDPILEPYRRAVSQVIDALRPFPAFVVDSTFRLVETNSVGRRLLPGVVGDRANLVDVFLAPGPAREIILNFSEVAWSWHDRLLRATAAMDSLEVASLRRRVGGYLENVERPIADASGAPVLCPTFSVGGATVRTIGMTMSFGPSRDVTLEELSVDVLCPRDDEARRFFEMLESSPV
jgi:transcriptional regulator with XRE-family HTH domain